MKFLDMRTNLMKHALSLMVSVVFAASMHGCATKTYDRQTALTEFEKSTMTCSEINLELVRLRSYVDHVNKESEFSALDVLAMAGDLGMGNSAEKDAALRSANIRIEQLRDLKTPKKCDK